MLADSYWEKNIENKRETVLCKIMQEIALREWWSYKVLRILAI